jgi:hypothetical protein
VPFMNRLGVLSQDVLSTGTMDMRAGRVVVSANVTWGHGYAEKDIALIRKKLEE